MKYILLSAVLLMSACGGVGQPSSGLQASYDQASTRAAHDRVQSGGLHCVGDWCDVPEDPHNVAIVSPSYVEPVARTVILDAPVRTRTVYAAPAQSVYETTTSSVYTHSVPTIVIPSVTVPAYPEMSSQRVRPAGYTGNCYFPDDLDSAGRRCGKRSAVSRPGGY